MLITNPGPLSQYYSSLIYQPLLPLIALPTTTGSDVTSYSVIITEESSNTPKILLIKGSLAICDPEFTYSLPAGLTSSPKSDVLSRWGIQQIFKWLPQAVAELVLNDACYSSLSHPLTKAEVEDFLRAVYDSYQ